MRVVFLDIDGVTHPVSTDPESRFRPECMQRLHRLIHNTGAQIVLSSSWRLSLPTRTRVHNALTAHSIPVPFSMTRCDRPRARKTEISLWLAEHRNIHEVTHYVVLDDTPIVEKSGGEDDGDDVEGIRNHCVLVKGDRGLSDDDVEKALQILMN
eukprot:PhF_6_TR40187/c1_g2_i1/m.59619